MASCTKASGESWCSTMPILPKPVKSRVQVSFWCTKSESRTSAKRTACSSCGVRRQPMWCGAGLADSSSASPKELARRTWGLAAPRSRELRPEIFEILAAKRMMVEAKRSETKRSTVCPSTEVCSKLTPAEPLAHTMICILSYHRLVTEPTCTPSPFIAYVPCSMVRATAAGVGGASSSRQSTKSAESMSCSASALTWSRQSSARRSCHSGRFSEVSTPTLCSSWSCSEIPPGTAHALVAVRASSRMRSRFSRRRPSETHRVPSPQKASKW
mmetsp:Transcript_16167/g.38429  ORF Transcript_16167/g.38429 Transcript_16167/m.38429 type:complete len:271 (-) Transcript_16167:26-838(-)